MYREPSHRGVRAQNLQTSDFKNVDEVTSVPIFSADDDSMSADIIWINFDQKFKPKGRKYRVMTCFVRTPWWDRSILFTW